jgi:hypothetical protein
MWIQKCLNISVGLHISVLTTSCQTWTAQQVCSGAPEEPGAGERVTTSGGVPRPSLPSWCLRSASRTRQQLTVDSGTEL